MVKMVDGKSLPIFDGYKKVQVFLPHHDVKRLEYCINGLEDLKRFHLGDDQCPTSHVYVCQDLFDTVGYSLVSLMNKHTGLDLFPTYSYARTYLPGSELLPHTDRKSCEISVTVCLDKHPKDLSWPLGIEGADGTASNIDLDISDAIIYKGSELTHWRAELQENSQLTQIFFHYVDKNGEFYKEALSIFPELADFNMWDIDKILTGRELPRIKNSYSPQFDRKYDGTKESFYDFHGYSPEDNPFGKKEIDINDIK